MALKVIKLILNKLSDIQPSSLRKSSHSVNPDVASTQQEAEDIAKGKII